MSLASQARNPGAPGLLQARYRATQRIWPEVKEIIVGSTFFLRAASRKPAPWALLPAKPPSAKAILLAPLFIAVRCRERVTPNKPPLTLTLSPSDGERESTLYKS